MSNQPETNETAAPVQGRKVGLPRFFELMGRDLWPLYKSSFLCVLGFLPGTVLAVLGMMGHSALLTVVGGVLAGLAGGPFLSCMMDTVLRALRDEPGYWWVTYRRAWKRNAKAALLPGAICGLLLAMEIFTAFHTETGSVAVTVAIFVALILLAGIAQYLYAQVALVDLPFSSLLKNSLMLFLGYLPRSALGILWQGLYWAAIALFWPLSGAVLILTSLWFPCSLSLLAIYPALNKSFDLEAKIKAMRDAQLDSHDED